MAKKKIKKRKEKVMFQSLSELEKYFATEDAKKEKENIADRQINKPKPKGTGLARSFLQNF